MIGLGASLYLWRQATTAQAEAETRRVQAEKRFTEVRKLGVSLVEYRNRLRIERFHVLAGTGADSLQAVARAAGFGSYAQFHRVFRAVHGTAPKAYLRAR